VVLEREQEQEQEQEQAEEKAELSGRDLDSESSTGC